MLYELSRTGSIQYWFSLGLALNMAGEKLTILGSLRDKCPNTGIFFGLYLDTFHAWLLVFIKQWFVRLKKMKGSCLLSMSYDI